MENFFDETLGELRFSPAGEGGGRIRIPQEAIARVNRQGQEERRRSTKKGGWGKKTRSSAIKNGQVPSY